MQVVELKQSNVITTSPQTLSVDFSEGSKISDPSLIGAADRFRDWE